MPGVLEIMGAVRTGLDSLTLSAQESSKDWTKAVKTKLCELGRELGCQVAASGVKFGYREWLYDVTWLEYSQGYEPGLENQLVDVHLVAECEWGEFGAIKNDFEKLLLARASLHLMIYDGNRDPGSDAIADHLAEYVCGFKDARGQDAWLLAALERDAETGNCSFRYFVVSNYESRATGFGLFTPGFDWSVEPRDPKELIRRGEAVRAEVQEHERRTATQQSLSGLRFKL